MLVAWIHPTAERWDRRFRLPRIDMQRCFDSAVSFRWWKRIGPRLEVGSGEIRGGEGMRTASQVEDKR